MSERNALGTLALCVVMMTTMTASLGAKEKSNAVINDRITGQATAPTKAKKLPGKKKRPTLTLKRGKNSY